MRLVNQKLLRCGYTTGSCAAAASKAAAFMLLSGETVSTISVVTPNNTILHLDVLDVVISPDSITCAVRKDSGDDPDITNGVLVYATVSHAENGITIDGGRGVGRVTKEGLDQPVGAAAINSVPREMIAEAVRKVMEDFHMDGGLDILISVPDGVRLAKRTFNPRLGIEGGISVLGTSGVVEPMSAAAIVDTIRAEVNVLAAQGKRDILITIGNYGESFAVKHLGLSLNSHIKCGNYIGDTLAAAIECGFRRILVIGHIGKLVKLGIGLTNTHSSNGDGRMETLIACALKAGADLPLLRLLGECVTTDAALELLHERDIQRATLDILGERIDTCLIRHTLPGTEIGFICFTNAKKHCAVLAQSKNAGQLMDIWRES